MTRRSALATILTSLGALLAAAFGRPVDATPPAHRATTDAQYLAALREVIQPMPGGVRLGRKRRP